MKPPAFVYNINQYQPWMNIFLFKKTSCFAPKKVIITQLWPLPRSISIPWANPSGVTGARGVLGSGRVETSRIIHPGRLTGSVYMHCVIFVSLQRAPWWCSTLLNHWYHGFDSSRNLRRLFFSGTYSHSSKLPNVITYISYIRVKMRKKKHI